MASQSSLEEITKRLVQLAMEKKLRSTLVEVAGELPEEVMNELYQNMFKPVMVITMIKLMEVMKW